MSASKKNQKEITTAHTAPVAIVGMAGIFPQAENLARYWANIFQEVNCITEVPSSRWSVDEYYDSDPNMPDKTYSRHGGFIPDIQFDPMEFGLPPNFLEVTDVSQLLGLVVARDALADAGYPDKGKEIFDRTGVILGMVGMSSKVIQPLLNRLQYPVWEKVLRASAVPETEIPAIIERMKLAYIGWNENAFPGAIGNVVAGRIANRFDLGGTNCIVDAACGSSLAAVSMAVNELSLGRADMMITGGVDTDNSILTFLCFSKTPAFSKGDRLRAFSAESDGMLAGEGVGMLVLKRLTDAERDGDRIYAVIRGVGTSSDGYFKSIYAPRPSGQAKAVQRAYETAGYSPTTVGLVEAHGTGTNAGDPAEFEGLREVFSRDNEQKQHIALGSVKSMIGHTKATAGAASLIKASLALHHKVLPATINVSKPHPGMDIENSPFYLNTHTRPWFSRVDGEPRRAGVSSFGFGGTNFHIAVEEYSKTANDFSRLQTTPFTVLLSASTPEELRAVCQSTMQELSGETSSKVLTRLDEESSSVSIPKESARVGFIAASVNEAREKLADGIRLLVVNKGQESWSHPKGIFYRAEGMETNNKTVALFPGQGSQYVNMGLELAVNFPAFRAAFEHADEQVSQNEDRLLTSVVYPIPVFSEEERKAQQEALTATQNAQPAIGAFSMGLFQVLSSAGFQADFFAGHSFGELTALWAGGMLEDESYIRLAVARGQAMSAPAASDQDTGSMAAVKGNVEEIRELIKDHTEVKIANFNSPSQVVLAGSTQGIKEVQPVLESAGMSVYPLNVSAAFHTKFVKHAKVPFSKAIKAEKFGQAKGKVYSNTTAQPYPEKSEDAAQTLSDHILNSVRFQEEIENIYEDGGRIFIEVGPKNVLSNLVKDILGEKPHEIVTCNPNTKADSDAQFRQTVLQMRILGFALGNIDPYKSHEIAMPKVASKVAVMLNGGLYTTEATKQKFEQALKEAASQKKPSLVVKATTVKEQNPVVEIPAPDQPDSPIPTPTTNEIAPMKTNNEIEQLIEKLQVHQSALLKAHEQFLQNDNASKTLLQQITGKELTLLESKDSQPDERALSALEKRAEYIASQHEATSSTHQSYIESQTDFTRQYAALIQNLMGAAPQSQVVAEPAQKVEPSIVQAEPRAPAQQQAEPVEVTAAPAEAPVESVGAGSDELNEAFLSIVSEKTGYPVDMLEVSMDMEADLGIDSIKRVEILGAMQEKYPELPTIEAEDLVELRTLAQVIGAFDAGQPAPAKSVQSQNVPESIVTSVNPAASPTIDTGEVQQAFLEIVSEKTGYPVDMLEVSMDMEADLGIDSIKRVEILGAVQEKYPELPTIGAEDLVELRTLAEVIHAFTVESSGAPAAKATPSIAESQPVQESTPLSSEFQADEIKSSFLEVVSEKTGYPTEMLELEMDMEADLGIDSIKRVEILGAIQEKYPELPSISAEELVELRTLGQIIDNFNAGNKVEISPAPAVQQETVSKKNSSIAVMPVAVKPLPKPDQVAVEFPEGSAVMISAEDADWAAQLGENFAGKGLKVGLVHLFPNGKTPDVGKLNGFAHYTLAKPDEAEIEGLMQRVTADHGKIAAFFHLETVHSNKNGDPIVISEDGERSLKSLFLMARHLKSPLANTAADSRPAFITVTKMDGQFGLNGFQSTDPLPGGFAGLVKSLRQEWPNVFCRALDFHPDLDNRQVVDRIMDEFHDADLRLSEVGYTAEGRFTIALDEENQTDG